MSDRPEKELRIGLVLYGGVSLAVYMNGIVSEIWRVLQASKAANQGTAGLESTAPLYLELLGELETREDTDALRVVVDAVAGTSAGGLNGAVLGKAITEGGDAAVLRDVWIDQADIAILKDDTADSMPWFQRKTLGLVVNLVSSLKSLRDKIEGLPGLDWAWVRDQTYRVITSKDGKATPLKGDVFAELIARTFHDMGRNGERSLMPPRGSFDLFLTGTDLSGWPRHLPVSTDFHPEPLYERSHADWSHFRKRPNGAGFEDDFGLTYASRRTAGFPGAFAPITGADIEAAYRKQGFPLPQGGSAAFARRHLPEHSLAGFPAERAWMVDGGVLDNRPFSHVAQAIERKPADREVYRSLIFIEPSPKTDVLDHPSEAMPSTRQVLTGLFGLFRHEPILADLRNLDDRNRAVTRILEALDAARPGQIAAAEEAGQKAVPALTWPVARESLEDWRKATNAFAAAALGYPAYQALKLRRAGRELAERVCQALSYPYPSRHAFFVRRLIEAMLVAEGVLPRGGDAPAADAAREFLKNFDVRFRMQRLRWLVRAANLLYADPSVPRAELDAFKRSLADSLHAYERSLDDAEGLQEKLRQVLGEGAGHELIEGLISENRFDPSAFLVLHGGAIRQVYEALAQQFRQVAEAQKALLDQAMQALGDTAFAAIAESFVTFPFVDLTAFPIMDLAGIDELCAIRTLRISPLDNLTLRAKELKSDKLGAFAGFLDRKARIHDLIWGRLDGAERLVDLLIAAASGPTTDRAGLESLRRETKRKLFARILEEERDALAQLDALDRQALEAAVGVA